jgi:ADP-ribosyl-[dinitrogen reductase] hydrolase
MGTTTAAEGINMKSSSTVTMKNLPLLIDTLTIPGVPGQIGITSCPGMKDEFCCLDTYQESLNDDLLTIRNWGAIALVTLLDGSELTTLGVNELSGKAMSHNLVWIHLPIRNLCIPDEKFEEQWAWAGPRLNQWLREGHRIVIHCKEGIGRAGVVAARLMIEMGIHPAQAIKEVQKARPGSLQLYAHEKYCYSLAIDRQAEVPDRLQQQDNSGQ